MLDGDLGPVFTWAPVYTLPELSALLTAKRNDMLSRDKNATDSASLSLVERTKEHCDMLVDQGSASTERLGIAGYELKKKVPSHKAAPREGEDEMGDMQLGELAPEGASFVLKKTPMPPFELAQISTLLPRSVDEATTLIPSLKVYDKGDLHELITRVLAAAY